MVIILTCDSAHCIIYSVKSLLTTKAYGFLTRDKTRYEILSEILGFHGGDFWNVITCKLVEFDRCFRRLYCLHHQYNFPSKQLRQLPSYACTVKNIKVILYWSAML